MVSSQESNAIRIRELVKFETISGSLAKQVILRMSFRNTLAAQGFTAENFPDITTTLSLQAAKALILGLQRDIDTLELGMEHPLSPLRDYLFA